MIYAPVVDLQPNDPEANYELGKVFAAQNTRLKNFGNTRI